MKTNKLLIATLAMSLLCSSCSVLSEDTGSIVGTLDSLDKDKPESGIIIDGSVDTNIVPEEEEQPSLNEIQNLQEYCQYMDEVTFDKYIDLVLSFIDDYSLEEVEIASYKNLKKHGLTIQDVQTELHNILVFSQVPTGFPPSIFEQMVGKLAKTLPVIANPFESYMPLAIRVHEFNCKLEHSQNDYGVYTCKYLDDEYNRINGFNLQSHLDREMISNKGYQKILKAMESTGNSLDIYIAELENLVEAQKNPTCLPGDVWYILFGNLDATLDYEESLYETYIDLAVYVHNILYPEDALEKDESGSYLTLMLKP